MAFEGISGGLQNIFKKLTGRGRLSEKDVKDTMREIKLVLLEADVNFLVVKDFVKKVSERAVGTDVLESLTPGQQIIKIVNEEMTALMGATNAKLDFGSTKPAIILMAGLQGAGKTTMCGKLAMLLKKQYGKNPLLCACDVYRPAAIDQLKIVGEKTGVPVFEKGQIDPVKIASEAVEYARRNFYDVLIVDTAGRLHVDEDMMTELKKLRDLLNPAEVLLVIDAMTGQDAVNAAKAFHEAVPLTGVILTKLDGDTRGGAALSVKAVTGKPIKFAGTGEKLTDIEPFHPDRMASRILGMGDVLTLIEKAQQAFDEKKAAEMEKKMRTASFDLNDFLDHPHREGPAGLRREEGRRDGEEDADRVLRSQRLSRPDGADAEHGLHGGHAQDDPRGVEAGERAGGRKAARPHQGHHPVHDQGGAGEPGPAERQPPEAHRQGQRHQRPGGEPAHEPVQPEPPAHEADDQQEVPEAGRPGRLPLRILRTEKMGTTRFSYIKKRNIKQGENKQC